ncbi:protein PAL OF QUIRKY-like [Cornus florida]|uniref:protein PAL OF QUIRKY-like n=1 Tax=Cornus florida TaxID=4283 RepID=UPI0028A0E63B|nr:protein PAL OF QUIRKY-like [Cornus florida]
MDPPPPLSAAAVVSAPPHLNYPDSGGSSPRSRNTDSWDEQSMPTALGGGGGAKLRLMCSYGGRIVPRPHDKSLCYVGGDTRMVVVDRNSTLSDLTNRLSKTLLNGRSFNLKYQLPNEDLDSLISVTTDEDLDNMIEEHDRLTNTTTTASKSSRVRLFLFPSKSDSASSIGSLLENSTKSEDWFLNALNGATDGFSDAATMNCLLGLGDDVSNSSGKDVEAQLESFGKVKGVSGSNSGKSGVQDVQSVPDSPMMEKNSSFGSTSSSPSLANLPPIRVHVDDQKVAAGEIEEQFAQMSVGAKQDQDHGGLGVLASQQPATVLTSAAAAMGVPVGTTMVSDEYPNWVFSYDERSEQGIPIGYRTQAQPPPQPMPMPMPPQSQQLKTSGGLDLQSPESVSSDGSIPNQMSHERPMIYQDQVVQITSRNNRISVNPVDPNLSDPNSRVQMKQLQDSGYVLVNQFEQQHQQLNPQQQHFIQAGTQYIHHHPTGAVPITSYYPMYPSQQQHHHHPHPHHALDQQYPVYYMPARDPQPYNLSVQQSYGEAAAANAVPSSQHHTPSPPAMIPPSAAVYKTATAAAPQLVQVPSTQHQPQYVGFSQIHYPSQSVAPPSGAATANYAYQFADPAHAQIYYTQPLAPEMAAHYQTMAPAPSAVLPEVSDQQLPTDRIKQQIRTTQP